MTLQQAQQRIESRNGKELLHALLAPGQTTLCIQPRVDPNTLETRQYAASLTVVLGEGKSIHSMANADGASLDFMLFAKAASRAVRFIRHANCAHLRPVVTLATPQCVLQLPSTVAWLERLCAHAGIDPASIRLESPSSGRDNTRNEGRQGLMRSVCLAVVDLSVQPRAQDGKLVYQHRLVGCNTFDDAGGPRELGGHAPSVKLVTGVDDLTGLAGAKAMGADLVQGTLVELDDQIRELLWRINDAHSL